MRTAARLAGFTAGLALVFVSAWAAGAAVGPPPAVADGLATGAPLDSTAPPAPGHGGADATGHTAPTTPPTTPTTTTPDPTTPAAPVDGLGSGTDGLAATGAGYTLVPGTGTFTAGVPAEFSFSVIGADGRPVTDFDVLHEKPLHLVVLRRDTAGFQHLHPTPGPDGVWRVPLLLPAGGVYRAYTDFTATGGPELVLGTDLYAAGGFAPVPYGPSRVAQVDGYQVRLDGELVAGAPSQVFATITRDGRAVTDLEPHLGAFGHLVAVRRNDLAYLHVHPDSATPAPADRSGPAIAFTADVPSAGEYRLFLDFRHGGVVRTAEFTVATRP